MPSIGQKLEKFLKKFKEDEFIIKEKNNSQSNRRGPMERVRIMPAGSKLRDDR